MTIAPKYRKLIYIGTVVIVAGVTAAGIVSPEDINAGVDIATKVVAALAALLAAFNVYPEA